MIASNTLAGGGTPLSTPSKAGIQSSSVVRQPCSPKLENWARLPVSMSLKDLGMAAENALDVHLLRFGTLPVAMLSSSLLLLEIKLPISKSSRGECWWLFNKALLSEAVGETK